MAKSWAAEAIVKVCNNDKPRAMNDPDSIAARASTSGRRRRSRSKLAAQPQGLTGLIRKQWFGTALFAVMLGLTALHVAREWRLIAAAVGVAGPLKIAMPGATVRQILGEPNAQSAATWRYDGNGRHLSVQFDQLSGTLARISCSEDGPEAQACPEILGLGVRDSEEGVHAALGEGVRLLNAREYPALGAKFVIGEGQVTGIEIGPQAQTSGLLSILLWRLAP